MSASDLFDARTSAPPPGPAAARRLRGRLSSGHLLMIAAALVAGLANFAVLARSTPSAVAAVAARPLVPGEPLDAGMVRFVPLEVEDGVRATLLDESGLEAHTGWIVSAPVDEGGLVALGVLRSAATAQGDRAMSVTLPLSRAADGTLRAGDRVDAITAGGGSASYVLTDVPVVAVRGLSGGLGGTAELTVTLAVDEEGALRMAAAVDGQGVQLVRATGAPPARVDGQVRLGGGGEGASGSQTGRSAPDEVLDAPATSASDAVSASEAGSEATTETTDEGPEGG